MNFNDMWVGKEAVDLATAVEAVCTEAGCHVALTGGSLYKGGFRKDCDLLFYRIRQVPAINLEKLWENLAGIGLVKLSGWGWCYKGKYGDKNVDMFFPEEHAVSTIEIRPRNSGINHY